MNADTIMTQQIGDLALTLKDGFKRILPIQRKHKIAVIITTHVAAEMDMQAQMRGEKDKMAAGFGVVHYSEMNMRIEQNKAKAGRQDIFGQDLADKTNLDMMENADRTGHRIRACMKKNSMGPAGRVGEFTFDYRKGIIHIEEEVFLLGYNRGLINREGNKYSFGERTYVGKPAFVEALKSDTDFQKGIVVELKRRDLEGTLAAGNVQSSEN